MFVGHSGGLRLLPPLHPWGCSKNAIMECIILISSPLKKKATFGDRIPARMGEGFKGAQMICAMGPWNNMGQWKDNGACH